MIDNLLYMSQSWGSSTDNCRSAVSIATNNRWLNIHEIKAPILDRVDGCCRCLIRIVPSEVGSFIAQTMGQNHYSQMCLTNTGRGLPRITGILPLSFFILNWRAF